MRIVHGFTGASGAAYGRRLLEVLLRGGHECHLIVTSAGGAVIKHELDEDFTTWPSSLPGGDGLSLWKTDDLFAPFCSGSSPPDAMVVVPCSMSSMARIAAGTADTLLNRAADVCLKERRPLVLAVRETPISLIHIENMRRVTMAGGIILPASPGYYHQPENIGDLVDHIVGKVLDSLGIKHDLFRRWGERSE